MPKGVSSRSLPAPTSDPRAPDQEGFHEEDFRAPSEGSGQQSSAMRVLQSMSEMDFPVPRLKGNQQFKALNELEPLGWQGGQWDHEICYISTYMYIV